MDHAATTKVKKDVVDAMLPYLNEKFGNPSSIYSFANEPKIAIDKTRKIIADAIHVNENEIFFTAGGSEADNWAIKGIADAKRKKGKHIITSSIEHHAVINTCKFLESQGYKISYIDTDETGIVKLDKIREAICDETILISVMMANNEIGTIEPVKKIASLAHEYGILFHTDAVQAFGQIPINCEELGIDMLSASAHKINGPKGTGFLYVKNGIDISSLIHGGKQEKGKRAGTENVAGIVGFGKACEIAIGNLDKKISHETKLRDYCIKRILEEIPYTRLNGSIKSRLPNNINLSFQFVKAETILVMLDMSNIFASSGSACNEGLGEVSHVLSSIGLSRKIADGSIRFTIGEETTKDDIDKTINELKEIVAKLRECSQEFIDYKSRI